MNYDRTLLNLMEKLFMLRQVAAEQVQDGLSDVFSRNRAQMAYDWLGDNIEAFVDSFDEELVELKPSIEDTLRAWARFSNQPKEVCQKFEDLADEVARSNNAS